LVGKVNFIKNNIQQFKYCNLYHIHIPAQGEIDKLLIQTERRRGASETPPELGEFYLIGLFVLHIYIFSFSCCVSFVFGLLLAEIRLSVFFSRFHRSYIVFVPQSYILFKLVNINENGVSYSVFVPFMWCDVLVLREKTHMRYKFLVKIEWKLSYIRTIRCKFDIFNTGTSQL